MKDIYYAVAHRSQEEIDSFEKRYEVFPSNLIPEIFEKALGLLVISFNPSKSWGSSHVIYFVEVKGQKKPLVFRANSGFNPDPEVVMQAEKLITDLVLEAGVPANKVLYVDVSRQTYPFDFQIQEIMEGEDIESYFSGTQKDYDSLSFQLGQYLARFHKLTFEGFGRFDEKATLKNKLKGSKKSFFEYIAVNLDDDIEYLVKAGVISAKMRKQIRKLFDERRQLINIKKGSLVHHDLADHNIMFKDGKITGIFDWEAAVVGDPVLDLASAPTWKTFYPREEKMLAGYQSVTKLPKDYEERRNIYKLRTMLWKIRFAIRAKFLNEERKQRLYSALEIFGLK